MVDNALRLEALSALMGGVKISDAFSTKLSVTPYTITPSNFVCAAILGSNVLSVPIPENTLDCHLKPTPANPGNVFPKPLQVISTFCPSQDADAVKREYYVDMDNFFDTARDFDFTNLSSGSTQCSRGGEPYSRPRGWYRMALKVLDKYPDGNTWLGPAGWRSESAPGEWPVSYHGTTIDGSKGIIESLFKAGPGDAYGRGVYSTPCLTVACNDRYAETFKSSNGKTYKVIMQNRINPLKREICKKKPDYFLIRVAEGLSPEQEKEIVEGAIRPYGILLQDISG